MEEQNFVQDEGIEKSLAEAGENGLYRVSGVRSAFKVRRDAAKILIAIPFGDKDDPDLFARSAIIVTSVLSGVRSVEKIIQLNVSYGMRA